MNLLQYSAMACIFLMPACKEKNDAAQTFDSISTKKYYSSEILEAQFMPTYGTWNVYGTSGGFAGSGYPKDFDQLLLKPNGIFGIVRNDSLLTHGKIVIKNQTAQELFVEFVPETQIQGIDILGDNEKYIQVNDDTLHLNAPCCDRFDTHLKRL
jgi:hypothetical protein